MSCIYECIRSEVGFDNEVTVAFIADIAKEAMMPEELTFSIKVNRVGNDFSLTI